MTLKADRERIQALRQAILGRFVRVMAGMLAGWAAFSGFHRLIIGTDAPMSLPGQLLLVLALLAGALAAGFFDLIPARRRR